MYPIATTGMTQLERQSMNPGVAAGPAQFDRLALPRAHDGAHALDHHQAADDTEQQHVGEADRDIELAERAQHREQPHARGGAGDAASEQQAGERHVDRAPPPVAHRARARGCRDVAGDRRHRHRRRDAEEDQQRRHQESAADAEHAGDEADRESHPQDEENVHRQFGDGKIDLHWNCPSVRAIAERQQRRNGSRRGAAPRPAIKHFQEKWKPVSRPETAR
jgi:hypothetical protein